MCPFQSVGRIGTGSSVIRFSLTSIQRDLFPNTKHAPLLMELPDLNVALIEAYRNLEHTTRAAKEMARHIKTAQKQVERATEQKRRCWSSNMKTINP